MGYAWPRSALDDLSKQSNQAGDEIARLRKRVSELEAALQESHDALESEQSQHAAGAFEFTTHPLLR